MSRKIRPRLTYANVMSTLAVFIALGGSSYAAATINGSDLKYRSVSASKIKRNALTRLEVNEAALSRVPRAERADRLSAGGTVPCPANTVPVAAICMETTPRPAMAYGGANDACRGVSTEAGLNRRLPTHAELVAALPRSEIELAKDGELTSSVVPSATVPQRVDVLTVVTDSAIALVPNDASGARQFRCVANPIIEKR